MKVLLLSSPVVQLDFDRIARVPNLGLASLAAHVDDLCTVHVADIHGLKNHREYVSRIVNGYDLVGLTAMSFQYQEALALAKIAKLSGAETVFGGYHPTLAAEEIGESTDAALIDYIVRGEGEEIVIEVAKSVASGKWLESRSAIKGLAYVENDKVVATPAAPTVKNFDAVAADALGVIHRELGVLEHLLGAERLVLGQRQSDRGGEEDFAVVEGDRRA